MQVSLRRAQILVARQLLGDDWIAGVLGGPRAELVAQRVPHETLVAPLLQAGEREQLAPHPTEVLLMSPVFGPEHVRLRIVLRSAKRRFSQRFLQSRSVPT